MADQTPNPTSLTPTESDPGEAEAFMLRVARVLSSVGRETMFFDLSLGAAEILNCDIGLLGRFIERDGVPHIETLACSVDGEFEEKSSYPLKGTPCETVIGKEFRFYADDIQNRFPNSPISAYAMKGYAAFPLFDDDGGPLGILAVMARRPLDNAARAEFLLRIFAERAAAEIQRKQTEEALSASEEHYRTIFNAAVDGLALLSPEGRIVDVNSAMEQLYGYSREEMVGQKALRFASGPSRANAAKFLDTVRDENFATMVDKAARRDGSEFYIEPRGVTLDYKNRPHVLAIIRDVTERERAEQQRSALEAQLRQAQKMETIGHLTGGVAHDFNNILTSVLGYIELAHDHVEPQDDQKLNRYLERARQSGEQARDLIEQMLTFSRGRAGIARPLELRPVLESTLELVGSMVPSGIELSTDFSTPIPAVLQDPVHVEQILVNLCLNASEAMPHGGRLQIGCRALRIEEVFCSACHNKVTGEFVDLSVRDSGSGIAADEIERIFEPFYSTKETGQGSGMGLSTVHGIVHECGGHIVVESIVDEGTALRVLLPVADRLDDSSVLPRNGATDPHDTPSLRGHVLLVDDNEDVAEFVADLLREWGLQVTIARSRDSAIDIYAAKCDEFNVAIIDQAISSARGVKLALELFSRSEDLAIIVYSGDHAAPALSRNEKQAIRAVIEKPLNLSHLRHLLATILGT